MSSENSGQDLRVLYFRERRREETRQKEEKSGERMGTKLSRVSNGKFVNSAGQLVPFVRRTDTEREREGGGRKIALGSEIKPSPLDRGEVFE